MDDWPALPARAAPGPCNRSHLDEATIEKKPRSEVITLSMNVGGTTFMTTVSTLCAVPGSALAAMIGNRELPLDERDRPFIDRDPDVFDVVLKCLRSPGLRPCDVAREQGVSGTAVEYLGLGEALAFGDDCGCAKAPGGICKPLTRNQRRTQEKKKAKAARRYCHAATAGLVFKGVADASLAGVQKRRG